MYKTLEEAELDFKLTLSDYMSKLQVASGSTEVSVKVDKSVQVTPLDKQCTRQDKDVQTTSCSTQTTYLPLVPHMDVPSNIQIAVDNLAMVISSYTISDIIMFFNGLLEHSKRLNLTNRLFKQIAIDTGINTNPGDFVTLAVNAMSNLQDNRKPNILYKFAYSLGNKKPGTEETLFPMSRMPFGMVQYQIEFFSCTHLSQVLIIIAKYFSLTVLIIRIY